MIGLPHKQVSREWVYNQKIHILLSLLYIVIIQIHILLSPLYIMLIHIYIIISPLYIIIIRFHIQLSLLIQNLFNITQYITLCRVIQNLLLNRRFYVELNNEQSRWRLQKNNLPQGSVLSLTLFNIYTNDQPVRDGTRSFIYADDLCITAQLPTFSQVENTIEEAFGELT